MSSHSAANLKNLSDGSMGFKPPRSVRLPDQQNPSGFKRFPIGDAKTTRGGRHGAAFACRRGVAPSLSIYRFQFPADSSEYATQVLEYATQVLDGPRMGRQSRSKRPTLATAASSQGLEDNARFGSATDTSKDP